MSTQTFSQYSNIASWLQNTTPKEYGGDIERIACKEGEVEGVVTKPDECETKLNYRIDDTEVLRTISLIRNFLRAVRTDGPLMPYPLYALKVVALRRIGRSVSRGMRAALDMESCVVTLELGGVAGGVFFCWLSVTPELHAELSEVTSIVFERMDGALACVRGGTAVVY